MNHLPMVPVNQGVASMVSRRQLLRLAGLSGLGLTASGLLDACGSSSSHPYDTTIADARAAIAKALVDTDTPSISVALMDRERVIWAEAFGLIDKATKAAPSTDTLFCIGSCSKMLATIATMILAERGQLDLDQPLLRYLPEFSMVSPEHRQITVRMLINHSAGFPGTDYRHSSTSAPNPDYYKQVLQTLSHAHLKHAPGAMSVYSNDGFTLIQPLVQALTKRSYVDFVTQEIFAPLGMKRSRYATEPFADGSYAPGYEGDKKSSQEFMNAYASGGLYTTPSEMGQLAMLLLGGGQLYGERILQPSSVTEMARNQTLSQPIRPVIMPDAFGLGWDGIRQDGLAAVGATAWHKGGATTTYLAEFFVLPDEGLALMVSGASLTCKPGVLAERILLHALVERQRIAAMPPILPAAALPEINATEEQLSAVAGIYASYDRLLRIQVRTDKTLALSRYAGDSWAASADILKLRSDGTFSSDTTYTMAYQAAASTGESYLALRLPYGLGHYQFEFPYVQKISARPVLSAAWQARLQRRWLVVNEGADSMASPVFALKAAPDCPGYVLASAGPLDKDNCILDASARDDLARMCLKIPYLFGRDLDDVLIEIHSGEEWVRMGGSLFRPAQSVLAFSAGTHLVRIGAEGLAEWRRLPANGVVTVNGATGWKLYDQEFAATNTGTGNGTTALPGRGNAAYLLLVGTADTDISVTLT